MLSQLFNADTNIDEHIKIFEQLIYDNDEYEPSISLYMNGEKYYRITSYKRSILGIIIKNNRLDVIHNLYQNNIQVHDIYCFENIIGDVIHFENFECLNIFFDNGYDPSIHLNSLVLLFKNEKIMAYIVERFCNYRSIIINILTFAIRYRYYNIIRFILDNMDHYQVSIVDVEYIIIDAVRDKLSIGKKLLCILSEYGYDLDKNKNNILQTILSNMSDIKLIKYLVSNGGDLNDMVMKLDHDKN